MSESQNVNTDEDIVALLRKISNTTEATRSELAVYRSETDGKIEGISSTVEDVSSRLRLLEERLAAVEKRAPTGAHKESLDSASVELLKQFNLKNNVCISGVPIKSNENINSIISAVGKALTFRFDAADIVSAYRAKSSKKSPGLIIVKFAKFEKKLEFLAKKREKKVLKVSALGLALDKPNGILYVNNQLTPYFSMIFMRQNKPVFTKKLIRAGWPQIV